MDSDKKLIVTNEELIDCEEKLEATKKMTDESTQLLMEAQRDKVEDQSKSGGNNVPTKDLHLGPVLQEVEHLIDVSTSAVTDERVESNTIPDLPKTGWWCEASTSAATEDDVPISNNDLASNTLLKKHEELTDLEEGGQETVEEEEEENNDLMWLLCQAQNLNNSPPTVRKNINKLRKQRGNKAKRVRYEDAEKNLREVEEETDSDDSDSDYMPASFNEPAEVEARERSVEKFQKSMVELKEIGDLLTATLVEMDSSYENISEEETDQLDESTSE